MKNKVSIQSNRMRLFSCIILATSLVFFTHCSQNQEGPDIQDEGSSPEILTDEALLDLVQKQTFEYFWSGAEANSGLARERIHLNEPELDQYVVTTGGTGFGIMSLIVAIERGFIERSHGIARLSKIVDFLSTVQRFQGAWSHWINGHTGEVIPFSERDNGGDLVETAFLVQGLLCARQYLLLGDDEDEAALAQRIDQLWKEVEWNFYRGPQEEDVLFWHWSPTYGWAMDFRLRGYNETLITYILAASSPTYPITPEVFHQGWADGGAIRNSEVSSALSMNHQGGHLSGGPLFWAHYSYLGLDPRNLIDDYSNHWDHNVQHTILNRDHCIDNPSNYRGYSESCWGLTASYSLDFYAAHHPENDLGVISPTAALSSFPYSPESSMKALRHFYEELGASIWGPYGFYDAFSIHHDWYPKQYLAIDQGPIIVMIENYRSNLLWDLFMSSPEISDGLDKLGFSYQ